MKKVFGLNEVPIIIIIIIVIAAILTMNCMNSTHSANEQSAISSLKQLVQAEALWLQNGWRQGAESMKDYWTYDVSCLHRAYRGDGKTKVAYIPIDLARADIAPSDPSNHNPFSGSPYIEVWEAGNSTICQPKSGYWFSVMINDNLTGQTDPEPLPYNQNWIGDGTTVQAGNSNQFAFMAAPDLYGSSGVRSFIVNETGIIYGADTGAANEFGNGYGTGNVIGKPGTLPKAAPIRWTTDKITGDILAWPTKDPTTRRTKAGKNWEIVN